MKAQKRETDCGGTYWTVLILRDEEDKLLEEREINDQFLSNLSDTDKDFIIYELIARCER
jgi:hypothetical protein